jgi:hypothetical protein
MNEERAHHQVVGDLNQIQARLRGEGPTQSQMAIDAVTVTESDVSVRVAGITGRVARLEHDLDRVSAQIDQVAPERHRVMDWRQLPEFNFCPQIFQLTLDDQIALLQATVAERLDREN